MKRTILTLFLVFPCCLTAQREGAVASHENARKNFIRQVAVAMDLKENSRQAVEEIKKQAVQAVQQQIDTKKEEAKAAPSETKAPAGSSGWPFRCHSFSPPLRLRILAAAARACS